MDSPASVSKPPSLISANPPLHEGAPSTSPAASPSPASWLVPSQSRRASFPSPTPQTEWEAQADHPGSESASEQYSQSQVGPSGTTSQAASLHHLDSQPQSAGLSNRHRVTTETGMMEETGESGLDEPHAFQPSRARNLVQRPASTRLSNSAQLTVPQPADAGSAVKPHHDANYCMHDLGDLKHEDTRSQAPLRAPLPLLRGARSSATPLTPVSEWAPLRGRFNSAIPRPSGASSQSGTSSCLRGAAGPPQAEHEVPSAMMAEAPPALPHVATHSPSEPFQHPPAGLPMHGHRQTTDAAEGHISREWMLPSDTERQAVRHMPPGQKPTPHPEQQAAHPATIRDAWRLQKGTSRQGGLIGRGLLHGRDPMSPCPMQDVRLNQAIPRVVKPRPSGGAYKRRSSGLGRSRSSMQPHMVQPPWVGPAEEEEAEREATSDGNAEPKRELLDLNTMDNMQMNTSADQLSAHV